MKADFENATDKTFSHNDVIRGFGLHNRSKLPEAVSIRTEDSLS